LRRLRSQLTLFESESTGTDVAELVERNHFHVKYSTFLGGLAAHVHRWFRLTPSFGPDLVSKALEDMGTRPRSVVLDPFAGAGTTLIEAKFEGHKAIGFEINPLLHFVCNTCVEWGLCASSLRNELGALKDNVVKRKREVRGQSIEELGYSLPPIHNAYRWWREDVLLDLLILLEAIRSCSANRKRVHFFELALAGILVPDLTNVTLGRLQLHFIDRTGHVIRVWETFEAHVLTMISDLKKVATLTGLGDAEVYNVDSTNPQIQSALPPIDRVVTSPPYPNRYSYVWNTRPHLYLLGFFDGPKEASQLDLKTIGGTWGSATSVLAKGRVEPAFEVIDREVSPLAEEIRREDNLMANYVMKYFNTLAQQIVSQDRLLRADAQMAYVVGCSWIKNVYIETDVLLGKVFEGLGLGYKVRRIERFRQRHSGKDLHESTVYAAKC
jgi:DNA modification methylase